MSRVGAESATAPKGRVLLARPLLARPLLAVVGLGLIATAMVAVPAGLIGWRLIESRETADRIETARHAALDHAVIARTLEGLRGLARQIRHAPAGSAGDAARRAALARLHVLATDPASRAVLPPDGLAALDAATASAARLSQLRAGQRAWSTDIADTLDQLAAHATTGTPRAAHIAAMLEILTRAGGASLPALSVLEARARDLAVQAVAAPGAPVGLRTDHDPFAVHDAIARALDIPALRRAALAGERAADQIWRQADAALAQAADDALTAGGAVVGEAGDAMRQDLARLDAALLSLALAILAAALLLGYVAVFSHALPLGRLSRRAVAEGYVAGGSAWSSLEHMVGSAEADAARMRETMNAEAAARTDAETLSAALLGAAPEAAAGRNLTDASRTLGGVLDAVRAQATLAQTESRLLSTPSGGRRLDVSSERAALAAHLVAEACGTMKERVDEAAHLVSALRLLSAPVDYGRAASGPVPLDRVLHETAAILGPRLADRGARLDLRTPRSATVNAGPGLLTAILCYVIEAAMLRSDDTPAGAAGLSAVVLEVTVGSDARVRLTIDDDGPPPTAETLDLLNQRRAFSETGPDRPIRLARALRSAPDAAALLLADGLARAALGQPLETEEGMGRGMRVTLSLPLHARLDNAATPADRRDGLLDGLHGRFNDGAGTLPPLLRTGVVRE